MSGARLFGAGRFAGVAHMPGRRAKAQAAAAAQATPYRRQLLGKIHIAVKQLGLSDDDYRGILFDVAGSDAVAWEADGKKGKISAKNCSDAQLVAVIERFKSRGWKAAQPKGRGGPKPADHKPASKARALWISLHSLGAIDDPSEGALEAFACRQLGCARLQWADQGLMYRLIEAEKAIAERHGWSQDTKGLRPEAVPIVLRRRLVEAIMGKLWQAGVIPVDWHVGRAAYEFAGMETALMLATASELDVVARELGRVLRENSKGDRR